MREMPTIYTMITFASLPPSVNAIARAAAVDFCFSWRWLSYASRQPSVIYINGESGPTTAIEESVGEWCR